MKEMRKKAALAAMAVSALTFTIPAQADTVAFLGGTGGGVLSAEQVSRYPVPPGHYDNYMAVAYPASGDFKNSIAAGLEALKVTMAEQKPVVVTGVSQGALVINAYKSHLNSLPEEARPDKVTFVTLGDPSNPRNGLVTVLPVLGGALEVPGPAEPTPYHTITITREYDFFADFPDQPWNVLAVANAVAGWAYVHPFYEAEHVDITAPETLHERTINSAGGVDDYYLVRTKKLPLTTPLRQVGLAPVADALDVVLKPVIDSAYDRGGLKPVQSATKAEPEPLNAEPDEEAPVEKAPDNDKHNVLRGSLAREESDDAVRDSIKADPRESQLDSKPKSDDPVENEAKSEDEPEAEAETQSDGEAA